MHTRYVVLGLILTAFTLGCGGESAGPKTELTDKDKAQIQELNEQRASEWGTPPKKK